MFSKTTVRGSMVAAFWMSWATVVLLGLVATPASAQTFTNLLSFTGAGGAYPGGYPAGALTLSGTTLYGMTQGGGIGDSGMIFSIGTNGSGFQNLVSFTGLGAYPGRDPKGSLTLSGTTLYGMTSQGGTTSGEYGNVFSVGTNGSGFQILVSFTGCNHFIRRNYAAFA